MLRRLPVFVLALAAAGAVQAAAPVGPLAGYREDGALSCDQLRLEMVALEADAIRRSARLRDIQLADAGPITRAAFIGDRKLPAAAARPARSPGAAAAHQARERGAIRRLEAAEVRRSLLAGLYQARGCRGGEERRRRTGPAETAMGAAD